MPRGRDDMQVNVAGLRRNIKNLAHNYSDAQVKVREATSNDPWGPSSTLMAEVADLTYNVMAFTEIMQMVWKRLNDHGKNWRHVYKALVLMEYLIKTGSEKVAMQCKENIFAIHTLKDFQYLEEGKDQGLNVREKAKQLVILLKDDERLKNERARALKAKQRFAQSASAFGSDGALDTPTSPTYPALPSESAEWAGGRETEMARPLTAGEEELQLQLALAMSREEAEKDERRRRSDDVRLQLAISQSQHDFRSRKRTYQNALHLPPITEDTYPNNTVNNWSNNASAYNVSDTAPGKGWPYDVTCESPNNRIIRTYSWAGEEVHNASQQYTNYCQQNLSKNPLETNTNSEHYYYFRNVRDHSDDADDWRMPYNYTTQSYSSLPYDNNYNRPNISSQNVLNNSDINTNNTLYNAAAQNVPHEMPNSTKDIHQNAKDWPSHDMRQPVTNICPNTDQDNSSGPNTNGRAIPYETVNCEGLPSPSWWLGLHSLHENVQDPDDVPTKRPEQSSHLLDLLDVNLSPSGAAPSASALADPWAGPEPAHRPEPTDVWSAVSSPARDPWAPAAPPPDPWAPLAPLAQSKSPPLSMLSSPSSSELEQFDALSRRPPTHTNTNNHTNNHTNNYNNNNNNVEAHDPFDLTMLGAPLAPASSTGAIKKSPSAFLGENSSLVNLERLLQPAPSDAPPHNPFAELAPAPPQVAAKMSINELKQQQMGLTGGFPQPAPANSLGGAFGAPLAADPWAPPARTASPWSPQNTRHTPNPFLS